MSHPPNSSLPEIRTGNAGPEKRVPPPAQTAGKENQPPDPAAEDTEKRERYLWRRKAASRRLQRCGDQGGKPRSDFAPQFTAPRVQTTAPLFEQEPEDMSGHIVPIRDAFSQRREHSLIFLGCLFAVLLMGASAWFMMRTGDKNGSSTATDEKARAVDPAIAAVDNRTSRISQASETMDSFLKTVTVEEKVPFVRGGAALLPVMREYYATHSDEPSGALSAENNGYFEYDGMEFFLMGMNLKDGRRVETAVEWTDAGPKLDWRFLTGNGDMEWTAWIESHPARPVNLRVLAVLDDYYAPPFADPREWICLKITDLARTAPVWAYIARESDEGKQVAQKLEGRTKNCRLMGAFAFPDPLPPSHSRTPQVRILRVAPRGWLDDSPDVTGNVPAKTPDGQATSSP